MQIHILAGRAAFLALISVVTGALVTSQNISAGPPAAPGLHPLTGGLTIVLLLWMMCAVCGSPVLSHLRTLACGVFVLGAATGASFGLPILHAALAQLFFVAVVCLALRSMPERKKSMQAFDLKSGPRIPGLAILAAALVMFQVLLGIAYRHRALGVMPHLAGALFATLGVLGLSAFILQSFPGPGPLRSAAVAAMTLTLIQVTLGIAVFVMALVDADTTLVAVLSVIAHVLTGALMLGASAVLAIQIRRSAVA